MFVRGSPSLPTYGPRISYLNIMQLKAKVKGLNSVLDALKPREHASIAKSATNAAGNKAYAASRRAVKKYYNINKRISEIPFEKKKAVGSSLTYAITTRTRMQNIGTMFRGVKQIKSGVKVEIKKGRKKIIRGAFVQRPIGRDYSDRGQVRKVRSNYDLVLIREAKDPYILKGAGDAAPRGIGWNTLLLNKQVKEVIAKTFEEEFEKAFFKRLRKVLDRKTRS